MKKRSAAFTFTLVVLFSSFVFSSPSVAAQEVSFSDIKGHWAESVIYTIAKQGIINGYPDGTFRPDDPVQVDQFIKMLLMTLSEEQEDGSRDWKEGFASKVDSYAADVIKYRSHDFNFENAASGYWATPFIEQAKRLVIFTANNRWNGDYTKKLNREDVAYLALNTVRLAEELEEHNYANLARGQIKDLHKVKHDVNDILNVYMKGIMRGYSDGTFGIDVLVTRAEAAAILLRLDPSKRNPYQPDLSALPHDYATTEYGDQKAIVFPSWNMKRAYDALQAHRSKSQGFTSQISNRVIYYQDEDTYNADNARYETLHGAFSTPLHDFSVSFLTEVNRYDFQISTRVEAIDLHEESVTPFLQSLYGEEASVFIEEVKTLVVLASEGKLNNVEKTINNRRVLFTGSSSNAFLYVHTN